MRRLMIEMAELILLNSTLRRSVARLAVPFDFATVVSIVIGGH